MVRRIVCLLFVAAAIGHFAASIKEYDWKVRSRPLAKTGFLLCGVAFLARPKCHKDEGDSVTPAFLCGSMFWIFGGAGLVGIYLSMLGKSGDLNHISLGIAGVGVALGCASLALRPLGATPEVAKTVVKAEEPAKPLPTTPLWPTFLYQEAWKPIPVVLRSRPVDTTFTVLK